MISSRDCLQLVEDIRQKTGYSVNSNTLRRFFGLVHTQYKPSASTINIFLTYCGFDSMEDLVRIRTAPSEAKAPSEDAVLHFLLGLYRHMPVTEGHNPTAESVVEQTALFLEKSPSLVDRFHREVSRTEAGRYYYFEMSVNMDHLQGFYGEGLFYYLQTSSTNEQRLFAHSLQVLRYWLADEPELLEKHMQALGELKISGSCPSHILGRWMAARIFHAQLHKEPIDPILADATKYHVSLLAGSRNIPIPTYPDFELAICEALVLTGHFDEAAEYIRRGKSLLSFSIRAQSLFPFQLWEYIIKCRMNPARRVIPGTTTATEPVPGSVLTRKYQHLLLLAFTRKTGKEKKHLDMLASETGFFTFGRPKKRPKKTGHPL